MLESRLWKEATSLAGSRSVSQSASKSSSRVKPLEPFKARNAIHSLTFLLLHRTSSPVSRISVRKLPKQTTNRLYSPSEPS